MIQLAESIPKVQISRTIKKVKLTKHLTLEVTFEETIQQLEIVDGKENSKEISSNIVRIGKNIIHNDMVSAMQLLRSHLSLICDQIESQSLTYYEFEEHEEFLNKYSVNSYSLGGTDINLGVTLSGVRYGKSGALNLNTQFTKFEGSDHEDIYLYSYELRGAIDHCNEEALAYLAGKIAPNAQLDLFENSDHDELDAESIEFD